MNGKLFLRFESKAALTATELVNVTFRDCSERRSDAGSVAAERGRLGRRDVARVVAVVILAAFVVGEIVRSWR